MNTTSTKPVAAASSAPQFKLVCKDSIYDKSEGSWSWIAVLTFTGTLEHAEDMPNTVSDDQERAIFNFLADHDIYIERAGSGVPGGRFADEPWVQYYPSTIIVSQRGGRDI